MTDENGNDYRQIAYQYFVDRGYAPTVAAGLVGNLETESSSDLDPNASDGNGAYGIGQCRILFFVCFLKFSSILLTAVVAIQLSRSYPSYFVFRFPILYSFS